MLRLMREVEAAGKSPHAGGLPGDKCARQHQDAHQHSVASQVLAQQRQIHSLEAQVLRLEQRFALLEEAGPLEALQDRPLVRPTPLLPPAAAVPLAGFSSPSNPPTPPAVAVPMARSSSSGNTPTPPAPAETVPLAKFASAGNVFVDRSTSPRLMTGAVVTVPPHSTTSSPVLRPAAGKPPSSAECAVGAWSAQPLGGFPPYMRAMQMAPTAAKMQPFFFSSGETAWSPGVQVPRVRGLPYLMPPQQQPMAMPMQQMTQMRSQPGPPLMPAGQPVFSQPLMGQPHMHMNQQQCMVPMPLMMFCSPKMPRLTPPPAGGSMGVSPAMGPPNLRKRSAPTEAGY